MPSITCTCGHIIGAGSFPNANTYLAVSEKDYDDLGLIESVEVLDRLLFSSTRIYQRQKCSELIVLWKDKPDPQFFRPN